MHCVFPYCTKPAHRCDTDHTVAHAEGGTTCSCNTAPLCRRHHRAKTHSAWDYVTLDRGTYLWTTPNGLHLIRDHHGTRTRRRTLIPSYPPDLDCADTGPVAVSVPTHTAWTPTVMASHVVATESGVIQVWH